MSKLSNTVLSTLVTMMDLGSSSSSPETLSESLLASEALPLGLRLRLLVAMTISSMSSNESKESWSMLLAGRLERSELPLILTLPAFSSSKFVRVGKDTDFGI